MTASNTQQQQFRLFLWIILSIIPHLLHPHPRHRQHITYMSHWPWYPAIMDSVLLFVHDSHVEHLYSHWLPEGQIHAKVVDNAKQHTLLTSKCHYYDDSFPEWRHISLRLNSKFSWTYKEMPDILFTWITFLLLGENAWTTCQKLCVTRLDRLIKSD